MWIALDWLIWACIARSFLASPEGKVLAGDMLIEGVTVDNEDVYMPSTARYFEVASWLYFSIIGTVCFLQAARSLCNCIRVKTEEAVEISKIVKT